MKILITGGAGFIGSHLTIKLLSQGHQVWVIDNLITGRKENLTQVLQNENLTFIPEDICQQTTVSSLEPIQFDALYHLASPASPPKYQQHPLKTIHTNTIGTEHLLQLAMKSQAKMVFASTSEVYGDPQVHPQPETYWGNVNSFGPRSCYDEAKRLGESICYTYHRQSKVNVKIARIFNTYGPHMDPQDGRVISNFITQALANSPITIYGDGFQTRSYCFVSDMIRGLQLLLESNNSGEVINLGNPQEKTVLETAHIIKQATQSSSEIVHHPLPKDDPQKRKPDITKAKQLLNWQPQVDLQTGLEMTIEYFKKNTQ